MQSYLHNCLMEWAEYINRIDQMNGYSSDTIISKMMEGVLSMGSARGSSVPRGVEMFDRALVDSFQLVDGSLHDAYLVDPHSVVAVASYYHPRTRVVSAHERAKAMGFSRQHYYRLFKRGLLYLNKNLTCYTITPKIAV